MNKNILNEINRYREIMGLPLLDEEKKRYSWGKSGSGNVNLGNDDVTAGDLSIANNIGSANLSLFYGSIQPTVQPVSKTETKVITMPSFTLVGGDLNYNDNCILPNISEGESKEKFNNIVNSFVNYINNGGFDQIQSITIQGSADSGTPSLSGNDHAEAGYSEPFNGETDKYKMNQFLANKGLNNMDF